MVKRTQTFSVRLEVADDGKVKAAFVDIGKEGDKTFKKIKKGGTDASKGLGELTKRARTLARQMTLLKAAAFVAAGAGGLGLLLKSSVDTAKNIRDLSNRAGVAVETFQELEFAARQFGVQQEGLADGLKELALRADEFVKTGGGPAAEAFATLGLSEDELRKNLDNVDALFAQVLERFKTLDTKAQKIRVLDEVFGGTAAEQFLEFMDQGNDAIDTMRGNAREFGVVFSQEFIDKSITAENQINTLGKVIKTNFQRGLIEGFVDEFGDLSDILKDPEFKRAIQDLGLLTAEILKILGKTAGFLNDARNLFVTGAEQLGEDLGNLIRRAQGRNTVDIPELGFSKNTTDLERFFGSGPTLDTPIPFSPVEGLEDENEALKENNRLQEENIDLTNQQATADGKAGSAAAARAKAEEKKRERIRASNDAVIQGLQDEITALGQSERQNFIDQATRRLSAEATETQRIEVERLAGALFDEREAAEEVRKEREREAALIQNIIDLTDEQTGAQERYNKEIAELLRLRKEEKITAQQLAVAEEDARRRMLAASRRWIDGVERALRDYADQATDSASHAEDVTLNFLRNAEDAFAQFAQTGKFEFRDLLNSIVADINRALIQQNITGPLSQGLNSIIGSIDFGSLFSASAKGNVFDRGTQVQAFASGGVVNKPTFFPMTNGIGLMGEAGPEAILPLRRLPSGKLGVESTGSAQPMFTVNVDARGSTDPGATAAQVEQAVDRALSARVPGIIRASTTTAKAEVIDAFQRRGGRFD